MLPEELLNYSVVGDAAVPHFLQENDHPWLRLLLDEWDRFVGRPQRELEARLREPPACDGPLRKWRQAAAVLARLWRSDLTGVVPARRARSLVFGEAARTPAAAEVVLAGVAGSLGVTARELQDSLFADLPGERLVAPPARRLSPGELALRANLSLAQALLFRATAVTIEAEGNARVLVRHAKLRGLICTVASRAEATDAVLELSGPLTLFRRTLLYGRALGELVPLLAWCRRFRLGAECLLRGRRLTVNLGTADPIFPADEPRRFDSRLEERFAWDFGRLAPDWDILREPEPLRAGKALVFPDFALEHRRDPARRWLLEIVGFWTPEYLARKLADYRAARLSKLILCIDEDLKCAEGELPRGALVARFRRRVDAASVLRLIG